MDEEWWSMGIEPNSYSHKTHLATIIFPVGIGAILGCLSAMTVNGGRFNEIVSASTANGILGVDELLRSSIRSVDAFGTSSELIPLLPSLPSVQQYS
jgi:hypothetical protein